MYFKNIIIFAAVFMFNFMSYNTYAQDQRVKYSWVQLGAEGKKFLRVISNANTCPIIFVDGKKEQMELHLAKDRSFNILSCIYGVPSDSKKIVLDGKTINVAQKKIETIAVIGDTGCRVAPGFLQNCKKDWPFKQNMESLLSHKPDLILHVGDYYYREKCINNKICKNENTGDNFSTWEDEFFKPAEAALGDIPWVFTRGNHEDCKRGGAGWVKFFDFNKKCMAKNDDYFIDINKKLKLVVMDSSKGKNSLVEKNYMDDSLWYITHIPFEKSELNSMPKNLRMTLVGHNHKLKVETINNIFQVTLGNGGTMLDKNSDDGAIYTHGFAILNQSVDGWLFTAYDYNDKLIIKHGVKN